MNFLTLLGVLPGKASEATGFLRRIKAVTPPPGVKILGIYILFGRYDGAIIFEAPDEKVAMNFILRIASPEVYKTETLTAIPLEEL